MLADILHKIAVMGAEKEKSFYPRPSSAGPEKCIRQMVYHGLSFPKEPLPGRTLHVFNDGNFHEELTLDWLRQSSFRVHSEQMKVTCRKPMTNGSIDGIVTDLLNTDRLLEHKAINHFTFERFWNGELPLDYLTQGCVYVDGIQTHLNPDLKEWILLVKNKNTAAYLEFLCHYEFDTLTVISKTRSSGDHERINITIPGIVQDACDKFSSVLDYIEKKTLPKRQYDIDHWRCQYCSYGKECWKNYEQEFNELATDAMLPNEIADMVRYYKELGGQKKDISKEYDDLKGKVKALMLECGAREGRAGEYLISIKRTKTERIDKEALTDAERERVTQYNFTERMYIKKIKEAA